jgi:Fur family ferric uptake transcriptional regulator
MPARQASSQERILTLLKQLDHEISAQELHIELRHQNQSLGLATIYRTLKALQKEGVIQGRTLNSGESLYSLVATEQQHYLTCVCCSQSIPVEDCPVCHMAAAWCKSLSFKVYYHTLEFFGLCSECSQQIEAAS